MISASLLITGGIFIYTHLRRGARQIQYRLLIWMILSDIAMIAGKILFYLPELIAFPLARKSMIVGNTLFYIFFAFFPYLLMLYLDYYIRQDSAHVRKIKLLLGIPCFLYIVAVLINLKTGWIFTVSGDNVFQYGPYDKLVFVPVCFYLLLALAKAFRISISMAIISCLLIIVRIVWAVWFRDISSSSFIYTMFLVCMHLYTINPQRNEVAL